MRSRAYGPPHAGTFRLLAPTAEFIQSVLVAAGPWLFTVAALGSIGRAAAPHVAAETLEGFRLLVIYGFALSLIATAPIVMVATRLIGDAAYGRSLRRIRPLLPAALVLSGALSGALALAVYAIGFGMPASTAVAGSVLAAMVGMVWIAVGFCAALRDHGGISVAFIAGVCVAVPAVVGVTRIGGQEIAMSFAFDAGLAVVLSCLVGRVLGSAPVDKAGFQQALAVLWCGCVRYKRLAIGGGFAALAIWIDKWVMWLGPERVVHGSGLKHAPLYDSAMFTAYLAIIPALAVFVRHVETTFFSSFKAFQSEIRGHGTLDQIEARARDVEETVVALLARILVFQVPLCIVVALLAPLLIALANLTYQQVGILRLGALGVVFQFVFFASTAMLLFLDQDALFLRCQGVFLALQGCLSAATVWLGTAYYGFGNLAACVLAGTFAFAMLDRTIKSLVFFALVPKATPGAVALERALGALDEMVQSKHQEGNRP